MENIQKSAVTRNDSDARPDQIDFAAIADSVIPAGRVADPSLQITLPPRAEESSELKKGLPWIWIAAGVSGALLGAMGAMVYQSSATTERELTTSALFASEDTVADTVSTVAAAAIAEPAMAPKAAEVDAVDRVEPAVMPTNRKPVTVLPLTIEQRRSAKRASEPKPSPREAKPAAAKMTPSEPARAPQPKLEQPPIVEEAKIPQEPEVADADLPESPSRQDVARILSSAQIKIEACAAGRHGRADVTVKVGSSGRVRSAVVDGSFRGSPEGSCMARAMRSVRFPRFTNESFEIVYPYQL